jgi:hypothetical protein
MFGRVPTPSVKLLRSWKSATFRCTGDCLPDEDRDTKNGGTIMWKKAKQQANKRLRSADGDSERAFTRARKGDEAGEKWRLRYAAELVQPAGQHHEEVFGEEGPRT